jgi:hypothetical protein
MAVIILAVSRAIPLGEKVFPVQPSPTFPVEWLPLRPFERRRINRYAAVRSALETDGSIVRMELVNALDSWQL